MVRIRIAKKVFSTFLVVFLFTGCSHYKSSWSCRNSEGIGCSSIGYADRIARKDIILNDDDNNNNQKQGYKKLLIRERYSDFKRQSQAEVDFD